MQVRSFDRLKCTGPLVHGSMSLASGQKWEENRLESSAMASKQVGVVSLQRKEKQSQFIGFSLFYIHACHACMDLDPFSKMLSLFH